MRSMPNFLKIMIDILDDLGELKSFKGDRSGDARLQCIDPACVIFEARHAALGQPLLVAADARACPRPFCWAMHSSARTVRNPARSLMHLASRDASRETSRPCPHGWLLLLLVSTHPA